jgi:hypothetical protein
LEFNADHPHDSIPSLETNIRDAADTLTNLKLRIHPPHDGAERDWAESEWCLSLRTLKRLEGLEIDAPFFLKVDATIWFGEVPPASEIDFPPLRDALPPTIKVLRLYTCGLHVLEETDSLAPTARSAYPALKRVEIRSFKNFFWTPVFLEDVRINFQRADVVFNYHPLEDYSYPVSYKGDVSQAIVSNKRLSRR